ncbi:hypothetical protein O181_094339 [Austropuccinia psidii MF-1]|uniref:Uncharacterized protein n=1 Tax=Austropuccinia psidii MF-1 TaxID=1389203 RepID=A0A9Q3J300_9BASI|nr:hypothetical protein [Austropuccinia psidii MF-1]
MPIQHSPPERQTRTQAVLTPTPSSPLEGTPAEEKESDGTEDAPDPVGAPQGTGRPTLAQSDQPVSHQYEPSLLAIMHQMTQIMANLQAASSSESSRLHL